MNRFKGIFRDSGTLSRLLQLLLVTLFMTIIFLGVGQLVAGKDMSNVDTLKKLQFFQSIGMFVLPPLILAYLWDFKPFSFLSADILPKISFLFITLVLVWVASPAINLLGEINNRISFPESLHHVEISVRALEDKAEILTQKILQADNMFVLFVNIGLIAVIPAVGEEFFFRGIIQKTLSDKLGKHWAVWITAIIFSTIHFQFYGFIPRMLMGAVFGYLLVWTGNIWYPVLAHFVNNATAVVYFYRKDKYDTFVDAETIGTGETIYLGVVSIVLTIIVLYFIKRNYRVSH